MLGKTMHYWSASRRCGGRRRAPGRWRGLGFSAVPGARVVAMGTNVYLSWNGMTDEEKNRQCTGFSSDIGHLGYLRASIWMDSENSALRTLFPPEFWELTEEDCKRGGLLALPSVSHYFPTSN